MNTPILVSSGSSSNAFTFIILAVFFGIILVLIIVATVGARKDKMEKLIETDKRTKERESADESRIMIFSSLNTMIKDLTKELENFKPSVGTKSLGEINKEYQDRINAIISSEEVKKIYISEDYKLEMKMILDELEKVKPSNWNKDATFSINLVNVKIEAISKNKDNKKIIAQGAKLKWN